ncbi:hypothetical protein V8E54_008172 [Elaphomyces granulatus]
MLLLWRVCGDPQPFSVEIGPAKTVDELKKAIDEDELHVTWTIGDYFEEAPQKKSIHIIIKAPGRSVTKKALAFFKRRSSLCEATQELRAAANNCFWSGDSIHPGSAR